ncbi:unnamed protein product [Mucor hiemalis]
MTELHNTNSNNNHTYSSSTPSSFDWFDRNNNNNNNNQQQLPPIHFSTDMSSSATTTTTTDQGFHSNTNMMDEDMVSRSSSSRSQPPQQQHYGASTSTTGPWMSQPTGYSPTRDSCELSYDGGDDYHNHNHGQPTPSPSASTERSRSKKHRTPSTRDIHVEKNTEGKPPYSYATLIKYAIENSLRKKLTLSEIYQWVIDHYPYYGSAGTGWKNSIRHNLSLNKSFIRVPRPINEPGKGSYWQVDYRAAEAELRSKSNLAVRGRVNRSGSDPYRPDSSWAPPLHNNNNNGANFNPRFNRDSRSLSMDSSMNTKQHGFSTSSSSSSSSSTAAAAAAAVAAAAANMNSTPNSAHYNNNSSSSGSSGSNGYYGHHGYGYNTSRHNSLNNRHSADYSRSSYMGYEMYAPVDNTTASNHHHYNHHHNRMQQVPIYDGQQQPQPQTPYGQMYSPGYPQGYHLQDKEEEPSFSTTPQPQYRRVASTSSPHPNKQEKTNSSNNSTHSPSPPQPSMDTTSKRSKAINKPSAATAAAVGDDYWIA